MASFLLIRHAEGVTSSLDPTEPVDPHAVLHIPLHALVHPQNEIAVVAQGCVALSLGTGLGHVTEAIVGQTGDFESFTFEFEGFAGVAVGAISTLLGLPSFYGRLDQLLVSDEAIDGAGLLGVVVGSRQLAILASFGGAPRWTGESIRYEFGPEGDWRRIGPHGHNVAQGGTGNAAERSLFSLPRVQITP